MTRNLALLLLLGATAATAQIRDLSELKEARSQLTRASDSLMAVRVRLVARRDSLSERADSLWGLDPESTELVRTRMASRMLVARLHVIEHRLDNLAAASDSIDASLRDAYDWEISRLHGLLNDGGWDEGLFRQLLVFQEEREELGNAIRPSSYRLGDEHELSVGERDGPDEIRQKIELAQDKVAEVQKEWREIDRRLRFLDRDLLVLKKYWHLNQALSREILRLQGDEHVAPSLQLRLRENEASGDAELMPTEAVPSSVALAADSSSPPEPVEAPLLLEAQRLKARQQELREVEAVLQERIGAFHERLARILDGRD